MAHHRREPVLGGGGLPQLLVGLLEQRRLLAQLLVRVPEHARDRGRAIGGVRLGGDPFRPQLPLPVPVDEQCRHQNDGERHPGKDGADAANNPARHP